MPFLPVEVSDFFGLSPGKADREKVTSGEHDIYRRAVRKQQVRCHYESVSFCGCYSARTIPEQITKSLYWSARMSVEDKTVLIVGCGIFGLASALDFAKAGYKVTAMDAYEPPSPWSASCDYNKIIRGEYDVEEYTKLSVEAIEMWKNEPRFKGIYKDCGRVMITPTDYKARQEFERVGIENLQKHGKALDIEYFDGGEELARKFPFLKYNGLQKGEQSKFNPYGGLGHSSNAMVAVYKEAKDHGVQFVFGDDGHAFEVERGDGNKVVIVTKSGQRRTAGTVIVSLGSNTGRLVNLNGQQSATGLFVTFIKLTDAEYERYKDCSILFDAKMGYFFPPDPETKLLKVALPGSGTCHKVHDPHAAVSEDRKISLPRFKNLNPTDTMPVHGEREAKLLLAKYVPELAYHELLHSKICWIGDTDDSNFIIDRVPGFTNLFVASGDSGHAFKFLPNIGKYILQRVKGELDPVLTRLWRWKNGSGFDPAKCSWRVQSEYPDVSEIDFYKELKAKF